MDFLLEEGHSSLKTMQTAATEPNLCVSILTFNYHILPNKGTGCANKVRSNFLRFYEIMGFPTMVSIVSFDSFGTSKIIGWPLLEGCSD